MSIDVQTNEWAVNTVGAGGGLANLTKTAAPNVLHVVTNVIVTCTVAAPAAPVIIQVSDGSGARDFGLIQALGTQIFSFFGGWPGSAENKTFQVVTGVPGGTTQIGLFMTGYSL